MKTNETQCAADDGIPPIQAYSKFLKELGRSRTTGWRMVARGWIETTDLAGKPYVTADAIRKFMRRAASGEFAKLKP